MKPSLHQQELSAFYRWGFQSSDCSDRGLLRISVTAFVNVPVVTGSSIASGHQLVPLVVSEKSGKQMSEDIVKDILRSYANVEATRSSQKRAMLQSTTASATSGGENGNIASSTSPAAEEAVTDRRIAVCLLSRRDVPLLGFTCLPVVVSSGTYSSCVCY
jgi:hypothetical protein